MINSRMERNFVVGTVVMALGVTLCSQAAPQRKPAPTRKQWEITNTGLGPFRVGMTEVEARKAAAKSGLQVKRENWDAEGEEWPELVVSKSKRQLFTLGFNGARSFNIRITNRDYSTREGARVGTSLRTLAKLYGKPKIVSVEGIPIAKFSQSRARRFSFWFSDAYPLGFGDPQKVIKANPTVTDVFVEEY